MLGQYLEQLSPNCSISTSIEQLEKNSSARNAVDNIMIYGSNFCTITKIIHSPNWTGQNPCGQIYGRLKTLGKVFNVKSSGQSFDEILYGNNKSCKAFENFYVKIKSR
jgi:hypothetical protein